MIVVAPPASTLLSLMLGCRRRAARVVRWTAAVLTFLPGLLLMFGTLGLALAPGALAIASAATATDAAGRRDVLPAPSTAPPTPRAT